MITDNEKVIRLVVPSVIYSRIMLVGQALGASTQRLSGLPYTKKDFTLSNTGHNLDRFLNLFRYTIDSNNHANGYQYAYSSDIVQCYPGKPESCKGDRKPNKLEILNCFDRDFLSKEISVIEPKLILLMGRASRDSFYEYFIQMEYPFSLSEHIDEIADREHASKYEGVAVIPIQHPSGANPNFRQMFKNKKLIRLIKEMIE